MTDVYRITRLLTKDVLATAQSFPRGHAALRDQLSRAATSTMLNLAEGLGRASAGDKRRAYSIALGELRETRAALDIAAMTSLISAARHQRLEGVADRVGASGASFSDTRANAPTVRTVFLRSARRRIGHARLRAPGLPSRDP